MKQLLIIIACPWAVYAGAANPPPSEKLDSAPRENTTYEIPKSFWMMDFPTH